MKESIILRANTYNYLTDKNYEDKKEKVCHKNKS